MNLWLASFISLLCALAGMALGRWFSRLTSPYWMIGYFVPVVLVFAYALAFRVPTILFLPPFSWMLLGMKKFAVFGFVATLVLTTPLSRISQRRVRILIGLLMAVITFFMGVWPFVAPMIDRKQLSHLQTKVDADGVCLQTTDYTCGPASAVTALRKLGLPAEEGEIAILSCTSFQEGTPIDMLADGLNQKYAASGLSVECRAFQDVAELKQTCPTLAVIKFSFMMDHWVTVLAVTDSEVVIGDPLGGLGRMSYDDFAKKWRFIGIRLQR